MTTTPASGPDDATPQRRVLVVEDEPTIAHAVASRLRAEGYLVDLAVDGPGAVEAALRRPPDAMVLDVMLPGFDGLEVCRRVQAHRPVPVLMLTARDDETDVLVGLGVGADDYMSKPFSMRELVARVNALVRRVDRARTLARAPDDGAPLRLGPVAIDRAERRVRRDGSEVHLTPTEFDLLVRLAVSPRTVLTRERLLADVWDWADASGTRTVDSHVKALRRKLGPGLIRTVHGVGYSAEPDGETDDADETDEVDVDEEAEDRA
jgi:DNA-binding response OmpR family regulator